MSEKEALNPLSQTPLLAFSLYTATQVQTLQRTANRLELHSSGWSSGRIHNFTDYYDLFWLWVLGAYEVLRTMDANSHCFTEPVAEQTQQLKRRCAELRMPFAKQELRGNNGPIHNENSVIGFSRGLMFRINGNEVHSDVLIDDLLKHLIGIKLEDIRSGLPVRRD